MAILSHTFPRLCHLHFCFILCGFRDLPFIILVCGKYHHVVLLHSNTFFREAITLSFFPLSLFFPPFFHLFFLLFSISLLLSHLFSPSFLLSLCFFFFVSLFFFSFSFSFLFLIFLFFYYFFLLLLPLFFFLFSSSCFFLFFLFFFSLFVRYTSLTATISHDNNNHRTSKHASKSWRSDGSHSCLGGSSHGWVPVKTHRTPVPTSVERLWVAHQLHYTQQRVQETQHNNNMVAEQVLRDLSVRRTSVVRSLGAQSKCVQTFLM